jgi:hypothetical protein
MAVPVEAARPSGWEGPVARHVPTAAQPAAGLACPQAASADAESAAPAASAHLGGAVTQEEPPGSPAAVAEPAGTAPRDSGLAARPEPGPAADAPVAAARCQALLRSPAAAAGPLRCRPAVGWASSTPCSRIHARTIPIADNSTNRPQERRARKHGRRFPAFCPCLFAVAPKRGTAGVEMKSKYGERVEAAHNSARP